MQGKNKDKPKVNDFTLLIVGKEEAGKCNPAINDIGKVNKR
jgi:hypothetical protein